MYKIKFKKHFVIHICGIFVYVNLIKIYLNIWYFILDLHQFFIIQINNRTFQNLLLLPTFYIKCNSSALAPFVVDQFDGEDPKEKQSKSSFYRYFYVVLNLGFLVSETVHIYIENPGHWVPVFLMCTISSMVASTLLLV